MDNITEYSVEQVKDPFGILPGKRYEFIMDIQVDEDDELYSEHGIYLRVIYGVEESTQGIVNYHIHERVTDKYLDFDLEDDELAEVEAFCREHYNEADN
ncbi:DUF6509 family protein [Paenibacillus sp. J22TS3]|uniref:DUF6509 family protein n=1 Tax=Paenibacillus sp. J22TS3 TaxID=2807192 RepID=UPI001AFF8240|nr:DUF6509 family protein [Paenibacillus sp. J22TS3]GIP23913.1 hypothetical protein J22TS3_41880 [Paenibacillus sp. J22TS3]